MLKNSRDTLVWWRNGALNAWRSTLIGDPRGDEAWLVPSLQTRVSGGGATQQWPNLLLDDIGEKPKKRLMTGIIRVRTAGIKPEGGVIFSIAMIVGVRHCASCNVPMTTEMFEHPHIVDLIVDDDAHKPV